MNGKQRLNSLQFKNEAVINDYIKTVSTVEMPSFICYRQNFLPFVVQSKPIQLKTQTLFIGRFKEART